MRRLIQRIALPVIATLATLAAVPATALDADEIRPLASREGSATFSAIGKLEFGSGKFCTATLIAPRIVLTAGHCLYDARTGARHDTDGIEFYAGLRDGRPEAHRRVRRVVVHPDYTHGRTELPDLAVDLALIELDREIAPQQVAAIEMDYSVRPGDRVGVVSYQFDRAERPSLEEVCHVLSQQAGALVTSCNVDFGASGAPILAFGTDSRPRLVSVVSAKAEVGDQKVSIGTDLGTPIATMYAALSEQGDGVFRRAAPKIVRMDATDARALGSAKFVKP